MYTAAMRRTFVHLFLLFSIFWQAFAVAGQVPLLETQEDREHAVMHWTGHGHHHDEGALHQDDSDESAQHVVVDGAVGSPALCTSDAMSFPAAAPSAVAARDEVTPPDPFPDALRRPPRLTA